MDTDYFRQFVGKSSPPVRNEIEKGAIRKFAEAIGDANPLYRDESVAGGNIEAPPTFSRTFRYGQIPGLQLPSAGLIHADQEFEYMRKIRAGDVLYASTILKDVFEKSGKLGQMVFLVFEHNATDESGVAVVREQMTIIYRGREGE